ncbi:hypothetical protein [Aureibacter tunicatorum]|uniref:Uncharacterized protein n=1 Tax=Aureibacter tunicatorum TaxID=866807 RepID=A0AAE3XL31_9BACT|nr:hypothetical protein [Aureibacter tunicatorum]MDR6238578.1 hypothetical protein [Aureibacter tunicatorum]BDD05491.1 hypothetical protein AUTU_29740 [Aureibacter tunicatorum]
MNLKIDSEFRNICSEILEHNLNLENWAEIESDDMFQTENYAGGFDGTELEFCFSYFNEKKDEFWFQFPLSEVSLIVKGQIETLNIRPADV